jgi:hypothetical protein
MTEPADRAQSDDSWEQAEQASEKRPSIRALAELIEGTVSPERVSDLPPAPAEGAAAQATPTVPPAASLPTVPPAAKLPSEITFIETMPPEAYQEVKQREVMPSNLPAPTHSRLPPSPASTLTMQTIENLVSQNQWTKVCEILGAPENQGKLPVGMAFIYAVALNELRVPGGMVDKRAPDIEKIMLRCLSVMLGADPSGPLTQIITKRLMRRSWRSTPAPPTRTSVLLIIAALMLGSFIGFLLGPGHDWFKSM